MSCEWKTRAARLIALLAGQPNGICKEELAEFAKRVAINAHQEWRDATENKRGYWHLPLPGGIEVGENVQLPDTFFIDPIENYGRVLFTEIGKDGLPTCRSLDFKLNEKGQIVAATSTEGAGKVRPFSPDDQRMLVAAQIAISLNVSRYNIEFGNKEQRRADRQALLDQIEDLAPPASVSPEGVVEKIQYKDGGEVVEGNVYLVNARGTLPLEALKALLYGEQSQPAPSASLASLFGGVKVLSARSGEELWAAAVQEPGAQGTEEEVRGLLERLRQQGAVITSKVVFNRNEKSWYIPDNADLAHGDHEAAFFNTSDKFCFEWDTLRGYWDIVSNTLLLYDHRDELEAIADAMNVSTSEARARVRRIAQSAHFSVPYHPVYGQQPKVKYMLTCDPRWEEVQIEFDWPYEEFELG